MQFANAGIAGGFAGNYVPPDKKDQIIAFTPLAGVGETVEIAFKAPAAGTYPVHLHLPRPRGGRHEGDVGRQVAALGSAICDEDCIEVDFEIAMQSSNCNRLIHP